MSARPQLADALKTADRIHDRAAILAATARLGREISADLDGEHPVVLTVLHGGLIFSGHLATELSIECEFDYVHATRYRGQTSGGAITWLARPRTDLGGRCVLLVDDILDEGHTLSEIQAWCRSAGARAVKLAVLCRKPHDRVVPGLVADYVGLLVPDRYVFGFGMDFHEQGRNLDAIYAL